MTDPEVGSAEAGGGEHAIAEAAGDLRRSGALQRFAAAFDVIEARVAAFVEEPERWPRVAREIAGCGDGPLAGIALAVKDVFRADGLPTRAGSRLPESVLAGPEASVVTRLRAAGAIPVGKAATTEFAYFAPGPTRNPHDLEHTPGGSSSGSAAAVATGQAVLALGTQTIGSVGRPAAFCGVVGFKPSRERISRDGLIPLAESFDHVGLFAPSVEWIRRATRVLWGAPAAAEAAAEARRPILAVPTGPYLDRLEGVGREHFEGALTRLAGAGYEMREVPVMEDFAEIVARHRRVVAAEAARHHSSWFDAHRELYREATVQLIETGRAISDAALAADLELCAALRPELESARESAGADLWITPPALGPAPRGLASTGDPVMNLPWTQAGLPAIVVPAGHAGHLPMGIQLIGAWGRDEALLDWADPLAELVGGLPDQD